ncbi:c-type cytochrome [Methylophaga sp. OBS4]|uniref:c-type cytochrome n=1 Tax=Methylophaga sp. OBS4 TaxID=2991935 RepID=UPI002256732B|nr:cytochrome c [Methylophaga sp. OBS4]MCX4188332.1 cytochrome c [Methylophaga sp. OBS4]
MSTGFSIKNSLFLFLLWLASTNLQAEVLFQPLGQAAKELSKLPEWNLSISPEGEGLPAGSGTAAQGKQIFALKCAACHGPEAIGGSAEPLVGEVGSLNSNYPEKTVNSYWPYATTLFDYIRRAMPIDAPFSLNSNEIYALCAYILSQDGIIDPSMKLNKATLPQVTMPNRDGFSAVYPQ